MIKMKQKKTTTTWLFFLKTNQRINNERFAFRLGLACVFFFFRLSVCSLNGLFGIGINGIKILISICFWTTLCVFDFIESFFFTPSKYIANWPP